MLYIDHRQGSGFGLGSGYSSLLGPGYLSPLSQAKAHVNSSSRAGASTTPEIRWISKRSLHRLDQFADIFRPMV